MADILVVDDMAIFRDPIAAALGKHGHEARVAQDGQEALDRIGESRPDLVLLDVTMPGMDGFATLRVLRGNHATRTLPVIMLTEANTKQQVIRARDLGVSGYILKSFFSLEDLLQKIEQTLNGKASSAKKSRVSEPTDRQAAHSESSSATHPDGDQAEVSPASNERMPGSLKELKPIMPRSEIQALIDECDELKGLSPAVSEVLKLTNSSECTRDSVVNAIKRDPVISLKLLRLANSSLYDRGEPADTVEKAVMRMGLSGVRQTVLNLSVIEQFSDNDQSTNCVNILQFWEHAIATAVIASHITRTLGSEGDPRTEEAADKAFTTGLLHDIGQLVFLEIFGDRYQEIIATSQHLGLPLHEVESRMLLVNHAGAMDRILHAWKFPKELINPIAFHHLPIDESQRLSREAATESVVLSLANALSHALVIGNSANQMIYPFTKQLEVLQISAATIERLESVVPEQTSDIKISMLSQSSHEPWPDFLQYLKKGFTKSIVPLFIGVQPEADAVRILCDRIFPHTANCNPTVAVVHIERGRDIHELGECLVSNESDTNSQLLPTLIISSDERISLDPQILDSRPVTQLQMPLSIHAFARSLDSISL